MDASQELGHLSNQESHRILSGNIGCRDKTLHGL